MRLTVLLGAGGVGKTTLAAGYALALARAGGRVGLLGIDPSRRLQGALGLALSDTETALPDEPRCRAAVLAPAESLRRWASESCDDETRGRLFANPFFLALADQLATATDVIAAIRLAEWVDRDPRLTDLVVDTAPGLNALEFLRRPRRLAAFLEGDLVVWLRRAARSSGTHRLLGALSRIGGGELLRDLASFLDLIEQPVSRMLARVAEACRLVEEGARVLLVTTVRDDAATTAASIARALGEVGVTPGAVVVNRTLRATLEAELARVDPASLDGAALALHRYARAYAATQTRVVEAVRGLAPSCLLVPAARETRRRDALADLGDHLRRDD
jgi:anion-transporting  ArsA/GET3 family ATPase